MADRSQAKALGIIPARGGSKRVHKKNLHVLGDKTLLAHTIESAVQCTALDRVILSSDDEEIIAEARSKGCEVPFTRPSELAQDDTPDLPVLQHALNALRESDGYAPDVIVILRPTAPFRTPELITACVEKWRSGELDSVRSMSKAEGVHHPYWMFHEEDGLAKGVVPGKTINEYYQSQLLPPVFRLNGVVDAIAASVIQEGESLYGARMGILETPEREAIDIDTEEDLRYAEFLIKP